MSQLALGAQQSMIRLWIVVSLVALFGAYVLLSHPSADAFNQPSVEAVKTTPPVVVTSVPTVQQPVPPTPTTHPHGPYRIRVVVFTYRRLVGLQRLLRSLLAAKYMGHEVTLTIYVDFAKKNKPLADDGTKEFVAGFHWPHGPITVHRRVANAGLKQTIMEAWFPAADDDEAVATFEDDIEVSPYWYVWAIAALQRYAPSSSPPDKSHLLGISLYRPIHDELSGHGCRVDNGGQPFALQQPCSWGAVFLPGPWRAFREWFDAFAEHDLDPRVHTKHGQPTSNYWHRHSSWKKYLIKLMHERGWYMVYHNLPGTVSLSTNHLMEGEHPTPDRHLFELPLFDDVQYHKSFYGDPAVAFAATMPPLHDLQVYDVMFHQVDSLVKLHGYT